MNNSHYFFVKNVEINLRKQHLLEVLLHYLILKKSAVKMDRVLVNIYGEIAPSNTTCKDWFQRFIDGDFNMKDKTHESTPKLFKSAKL